MQQKTKLIVIGNGMAGMNTVEHVLKLSPHAFEITVFGEEWYPNYNRILLSSVLDGKSTVQDIILNHTEWYKENDIQLFSGHKIVAIDRENKTVASDQGLIVPYDELIVATG